MCADRFDGELWRHTSVGDGCGCCLQGWLGWRVTAVTVVGYARGSIGAPNAYFACVGGNLFKRTSVGFSGEPAASLTYDSLDSLCHRQN